MDLHLSITIASLSFDLSWTLDPTHLIVSRSSKDFEEFHNGSRLSAPMEHTDGGQSSGGKEADNERRDAASYHIGPGTAKEAQDRQSTSAMGQRTRLSSR